MSTSDLTAVALIRRLDLEAPDLDHFSQRKGEGSKETEYYFSRWGRSRRLSLLIDT